MGEGSLLKLRVLVTKPGSYCASCRCVRTSTRTPATQLWLYVLPIMATILEEARSPQDSMQQTASVWHYILVDPTSYFWNLWWPVCCSVRMNPSLWCKTQSLVKLLSVCPCNIEDCHGLMSLDMYVHECITRVFVSSCIQVGLTFCMIDTTLLQGKWLSATLSLTSFSSMLLPCL